MADARVQSIAEHLLGITKSGKQRWLAVAPSKDAPQDWQPAEFATRLEQGGAAIESRKAEGRYPYKLSLFDLSGAEVGSLETGSDAESWLGDGEADAWEITLCDLYAAARGTAVDTDAALDGMLSELQRRG